MIWLMEDDCQLFFTNVGPDLDKKIPKLQKPNGSLRYLSNRNPNYFLISPLILALNEKEAKILQLADD